jgi:hypothetical protein
LLQQTLAHDSELGLDLFDTRTGLHSRQGEHAACAGIGQEVARDSSLNQEHAQRKISLDLEDRSRPKKCPRRDSDYGDGMPVNRHRLPHNRGVTAEASLPIVVAQNDDRIRAGGLPFRAQNEAARSRRNAQQCEEISAHVSRLNRFGGTVRG